MQDRFLTHLSTRLLVAALCVFPMPSLHAQAPTDTTTIAAPATPSGPTIPSGTVALLTLVTPINKKVSKPGDTVRAAIAFPVTVGNQIALPIGTIAEGQIATITKNAPQTHQPSVAINFTRLIFANGYTANLTANDATGFSPTSIVAPLTPDEIAMQPVAPPPPPAKPKGFFARLFTGSGPSTPKPPKVLIAAGWQFQMTLQNPVTLNASSVDAAAETKPI